MPWLQTMMTYYQIDSKDENPIVIKLKIFIENTVENSVCMVSAICPGLIGWFHLQRASVETV